jgi:uncharacterized membrane protein (UPF0136 family)
MFLLVLMLRSYCGQAVKVQIPYLSLEGPNTQVSTLKVGGLYGDFPLSSSVLNVVCADSALYVASTFLQHNLREHGICNIMKGSVILVQGDCHVRVHGC